MKWAYYNEFDPYAAAWLRNLIAAGHIANGVVDDRSILDVNHDDLFEFNQCHFFAGVGVWSHALRTSGWADDKEVWTGSCPCQPFSEAGAGLGFADERHLWPAFFHLISQRRPPVVFGEQVEAAIRHGWLDLVQADLEGIGYAFAAAGIPAAGVGAPHIRQRLWFVADAYNERRPGQHALLRPEATGRHAGGILKTTGGGAACKLDSPDDEGLEGFGRGHQTTGGRFAEARSVTAAAESCGMENADMSDQYGRPSGGEQSVRQLLQESSYWGDADWLYCRDGKGRPVEPGTFPLAHGVTARVGRLRAYGNAIVSQVAQEVITAYMAARP